MANAGLVYENMFIPSRFKHPERQVEEPYFEDLFRDYEYDIIGDSCIGRSLKEQVMLSLTVKDHHYGWASVLELRATISSSSIECSKKLMS